MRTITLPDQSTRTFEQAHPTAADVAESIGKKLAREAVAARIDGQLADMDTPLTRDCNLEIITSADPDGLEILRHSTSHIMALAVREIFGEDKVRVAIGPSIEEGFYYDFDVPERFSPEDLERIETRMRELIDSGLEFRHRSLQRNEAIELFRQRGEIYKVEILEELDAPEVSLYECGSFVDLCRGPHVPSSRQIPAFKLLSIAGAYWRGDEKRPMLQRIYGTAFASPKELKAYLNRLEEARKRDHRKLGRELELFHFDPDVAVGAPFFLPRGAVVYNSLLDFLRVVYRNEGYDEVLTPQVLDSELWKRSGHYANYSENMFFTRIDEQESALKPMNCPTHVLIYGARGRSYRELPFRITDFGRLHRYERSGVVHGLTRVRSFSQDDGHIFCRPDQIESEIKNLIDLILKIYKVFGFEDVHIGLSTRPQKSIGADEVWEQAENALHQALNTAAVTYAINAGDGAFYGPKIDFQVRDAIGREWQLATIQLDFSMAERFGVSYTDEDGERRTPVMIHRAMLGSIERFMGLYIEHTAGALPFWMAPVQATLIPVSDAHLPYCRAMERQLRRIGYRVSIDDASESMGKKIRNSQVRKVPCTLVIGDRECETGQFAVRHYGTREPQSLKWDDLLKHFHEQANAPLAAMDYAVAPVHMLERPGT